MVPSEDSLWERYGESRNSDDRNLIVERYICLVRPVACSIMRRQHSSRYSIDEFESAGYVGLLSAVEGYEPILGKRFKSFAYTAIRNAIIDWLRETSNDSTGRMNRIKNGGKRIPEEMLIGRLQSSLEQRTKIVELVASFTCLSSDERKIIWLKYVEGFYLREIGVVLSMTKAKVTSWHALALERMREEHKST